MFQRIYHFALSRQIIIGIKQLLVRFARRWEFIEHAVTQLLINTFVLVCCIALGLTLFSWLLNQIVCMLVHGVYLLRQSIYVLVLVASLTEQKQEQLSDQLNYLLDYFPDKLKKLFNDNNIFTALNVIQIALHGVALIYGVPLFHLIVKGIDLFCQSLYVCLAINCIKLYVSRPSNLLANRSQTCSMLYICGCIVMGLADNALVMLSPIYTNQIYHPLSSLLKLGNYLSVLAIGYLGYKHWQSCYKRLIKMLYSVTIIQLTSPLYMKYLYRCIVFIKQFYRYPSEVIKVNLQSNPVSSQLYYQFDQEENIPKTDDCGVMGFGALGANKNPRVV